MTGKSLKGAELSRAVAELTGVEIADHELLRRALTHASAPGASTTDYQRLEFLGDRVLALSVADMLYKAHPGASEGELSLRLNALVNAQTLAEIADESGLSPLIATGSELKALKGRKHVNLRADVMEALLAVIYLEAGLDAAQAFVKRLLGPRSRMAAAARRDPKTELQEWAHQKSRTIPVYSIEERSGPDHDPVFTIAVQIDGIAEGRGVGRSKREAERAAAEAVLMREGVWEAQEQIT